jgi:outer membrane protein OmpA-like peptidoglycan-associated protein
MIRLKTTSALALAALFGIASCAEPQLSNPNDPNARTKDSALAGAAIGALLGKATGHKSSDVVKGAIIGAGVGAVIGNQLDKQAAQLRQNMSSSGVQIINTGNELIVRMPQDILFAFNSDVVRPDLQHDLHALSNSLQDYPNTYVQVIGHTDNVGSDAYNNQLSQRRAQAVANVLIGDGVQPSRVVAEGRGRYEPIASNATAAGRAQNRRVEIHIHPMQG